MSNSLADALKQAGLNSSEPEKKKKKKRPAGQAPVKKHDHHMRSECELCRKSAPDVERYDHTNKSIDAFWLCLPCADRLCIDDQCRQTNQSDFSMRKMFSRQYGRTKSF